MIWNVYSHDFNKKSIITYNVFDHGSFKCEVEDLLRKDLNYSDFSQKLRSVARYYFWAKCEHEVVITSWPPRITREELHRLNLEDAAYRYSPQLETGIKIDIYQQLQLNWDAFVQYVYNLEVIK